MKRAIFTMMILVASMGWLSSQVFTNFEGVETATFEGWPNFPTQVINPSQSGINTSDSVGMWARGGEQWAHCYSNLATDLDFSVNSVFELKVYSPIACAVLFKLEDSGGALPVEVTKNVAANAWEQLTFDFSFATTGVYDKIIIFFDFATFGTDTFYFDDLELVEPVITLSQIDLPIDFESATVNYTVTDFGGNTTILGADPANASNTVAISTKDATAQVWAGTTMSTPSGFANAIPFAANASKMQVMVYSPDAGIPVRLKVEDAANGGIYVESEDTTTMANAWDTLVFDFSIPVSAPVLNLANTYNKASIFFNFGTDGATAGAKTYYWDDVQFLPPDSTIVLPVDSVSDYCVTYTTHFNIPAEVASAINLTITNVDATSMMVEIESADSDPVDLLIVNNGSGAAISAENTSVSGKISRTLTWVTPPTDVTLNVLWSKVSFGGNWQLSQTDIVVPFAASCGTIVPPPPPLTQMDLPVNFDDTTVNYSFIDFGGTTSLIVTDPAGGTNQVVQTTKGVASETWAGTTLATPGSPEQGFLNAVPFTATQTKMMVKVYSPAIGTPVLFKLEDKNNSGINVETQDTTTVANAWETLTFDFSAPTAGSFNLTNTYDKAIIFFNFGTSGNGEVYYWDDVEFDTTSVVTPSYTIFTDFDTNENEVFSGWPNTVLKVANPDASGINVSDSVGCWARGGEQWANTYSNLNNVIDFTTYQGIDLKIYSPITCTVLLKLESSYGAAPVEVSQTVTTANTWENLSFNFAGTASGVYNNMIIFFDFATNGTDTFYFDDVQLAPAVMDQIDLPIDFESATTDYTLTDFGGTTTVLGSDPVAATNNVAITTKGVGAQTWAGTTMSTSSGFATAIPFTTLDTKMSVKVYSPATGVSVLLKVEDHTNSGIFSEAFATTTVANAWETLEFDYATGNPAINTANTYDMASIFFDFGNTGTGAMYYWDDVMFVPFVLDPIDLPIDFESSTTDYTFEVWGGMASELAIDPVDPTNTVAKTTKEVNAQTWAGTAAVGNANGLANAIPFDALHTKMAVRVYSPAAGTPVLCKVENKSNGAISCEVTDTTTVANAWETLVFDLSNGTPALNLANTYDKVGLFFGFGNVGAGEVYYWDDVTFIDTPIVAPNYIIINDFDDNENVPFEGWPNWPGKVVNPDPTGMNTTDTCAAFQRTGETWAHAAGLPATALDFSQYNTITMKVWSPITCDVLMKLEDMSGATAFTEVLASVTTANEWVELSYNFTGAASNVYNKIVIFFDFASNNDTLFYFDEVMQVEGQIVYSQIDLPVDFEGAYVDYTLTDFGGAATVLGTDPVVGTNNVAVTTKTAGAQTWAGTTMSTPAGFATAIPFTAMDTKMSVKVYSPAAGVSVLLKVEDHTNSAIFSEAFATTTVANAWETLVFDYASGNPAINLVNTYDMASIFFDFGNAGSGAMYYWDDVMFVPFVWDEIDLPVDFESATTDYTFEVWGGTYSELAVDPVDPSNTVGKTTKTVNAEVWAGTAPIGIANGLANAIPFTSSLTKMKMRVYSPAAGIPILFKVEDKSDGSHSCETLGATTVANAWETIEFDLSNEQPSTPALNLSWTYNKVAIFFGFGNMGAGEIFYWDDIEFIDVSVDVQTLNIVYGWSMFSTYIDPYEASLDSIFSSIVNEVQIVKDGNGVVYWPSFNLNAIGDLTIGMGYQIKVTSAQTLDIVGTAVVPENTILTIQQGWGMIGYLRQSPADIQALFSSFSEVIIMKNGNGTVYWPLWGLNAIGNMMPGEGYQIKTSAQFTYSFPANAPASKGYSVMNSSFHFPSATNTGNNHILAIPVVAWESNPAVGDEIAVFTQTGSLVGAGTYEGGNFVVTLWGNDDLTPEVDGLMSGEAFQVQLWNKASGLSNPVTIESWQQGSDSYEVNGISVAEKVSFISSDLAVECYPNPATDNCTISFSISNGDYVEVAVYNSLGAKLDVLQKGNLSSGTYRFDVDLVSLPAGSYFCRVQSGNNIQTKAFQVIK
ncbi:MAG: T9SS type A sorting domain-containing protein [Bacteroidales bacterium]|nr:T9SS type A sorting domain-containing protein [Bacteroidales bacterium]MCF8454345.1 T9SS type A sorting domain-containing protein [Bacteroidales bacterium]